MVFLSSSLVSCHFFTPKPFHSLEIPSSLSFQTPCSRQLLSILPSGNRILGYLWGTSISPFPKLTACNWTIVIVPGIGTAQSEPVNHDEIYFFRDPGKGNFPIRHKPRNYVTSGSTGSHLDTTGDSHKNKANTEEAK